MKSATLFLIIYLLFGLRASADDTLKAVVLDGATGEPVPYASVYVSPSCGTISNYDGEFALQCLPADVLQISSIGYKRVLLTASHLPDTIRLAPVSTTMRELTVVGKDDLLYRLVRKMQKEANKFRMEKNYFFRLYTRYPGTYELAEAFLSAKSCGQIRDIVFHSGNRGYLREHKPGFFDKPDLTGLGNTNLHLFLMLSPIRIYEDFWDFAVVPSDVVQSRKGKLYDVSMTKWTEDDGTEIRKINVVCKPADPSYAILEGALYVDAKQCRLLRFEGKMQGLYIRMHDNARRITTASPVDYDMHIDYRHDHGFTEIANASGTIVKGQVTLRYLLFNLGDKEVTFRKRMRVGSNMLTTIDRVGYDSTLWSLTDIVKRTSEEERTYFADSSNLSPGTHKAEAAATQQEKDRTAFLKREIQRLKSGVMQLHRGLPAYQLPLQK